MDIYGPLFRGLLFPAWETGLRRRSTLATLGRLEKSQWDSPEELASRQLADLRALLAHARKHVPFYRERLGTVDVRAPSDLLALPLLERADALASSKTRRSEAPPFVAVQKATSGTGGVPLTFGYERASEDWRQAVRLRGYRWAGYRPGMRTLHFWGPGAKLKGWKHAKTSLDRALRRDLYLDCTVRSNERLDEAIAEIERFRPQTIMCFAGAGADLARRVVERGARTWRTIPVICGAEAVVSSDRAVMQEAFGPAVFETYGSREVMMMGAECEAHDGLHMPMENVLVELIVREDGRVRHAAPGEAGEVVVTDLHNRAMPFIRYLNGDRAIAGDGKRCACGRGLARLRAIDGRVAATFRDVHGVPVGGLFVSSLLVQVGWAFRNFQIVQRADDSVTVRIVKSAAFDDAAMKTLFDGIARYLGPVPVTAEYLDALPVSASGKRQVIMREP